MGADYIQVPQGQGANPLGKGRVAPPDRALGSDPTMTAPQVRVGGGSYGRDMNDDRKEQSSAGKVRTTTVIRESERFNSDDRPQILCRRNHLSPTVYSPFGYRF